MEGTRNKLFIALIYTISMIAPSIDATDFRYCHKKKEYAVKVSEVKINPDPVKKGQETSFTISASTDKQLSGGEVVIDVAYYGFSVYSEIGDLCGNISCPIPAGDFILSYSQFLPTIAPPGSYTLTLKVEDGHQNELTCIKFDFKISFFGFRVGLNDSRFTVGSER